MPTKTCSLCGVEKPQSEFNTRPNGTRFSRCKPCRSVIACANRRLQRKYQREELAESAIQVLAAAGPLSANQIARRIGDVTTQAVAMALASVPAHVTKHLQPHGAAIYTVTGAPRPSARRAVMHRPCTTPGPASMTNIASGWSTTALCTVPGRSASPRAKRSHHAETLPLLRY